MQLLSNYQQKSKNYMQNIKLTLLMKHFINIEELKSWYLQARWQFLFSCLCSVGPSHFMICYARRNILYWDSERNFYSSKFTWDKSKSVCNLTSSYRPVLLPFALLNLLLLLEVSELFYISQRHSKFCKNIMDACIGLINSVGKLVATSRIDLVILLSL
jgi:hypothetical protein